MFCPHCHNKIPDGSNICPLCYGNLAGVKSQPAAAKADGKANAPAGKKSSSKKSKAYTKGSRGAKKSVDRTPMIIAFGLILILIVIIAMIVRSMFGATSPQVVATPTPASQTAEGGFVVFGQTT
ncbi:MAG: hypothetical protein Q4A66_12775, partial [Eubacteriales bacterium]|nr:hypothetical protein [Eubacteriales bacterium]